jgi:hypothetical protein
MLARAAYSFAEQTIKLPLGNAVTFARTVHNNNQGTRFTVQFP